MEWEYNGEKSKKQIGYVKKNMIWWRKAKKKDLQKKKCADQMPNLS